VTEIPQAECEALVALYESTDGDNWTNNTGWLATNTPCSWYGVTCSPGNVSQLFLSNNQLNGPIPPEIGNLSALELLWLWGNQLSSPIPPEIGNLAVLRTLNLSGNQLSGPVPPTIGELAALAVLSLSNNQLSGPIPPEVGSLAALTELYLSGNQLSGSIPPWLGNLATLTVISLYNNQLSGPIPPEIGNLSALTSLGLSDNQLSGPIPPEIGNLSALTYLDLSANQLSGPIPPEISNLTELTELWIFSNQLSDPIPPELGNLTSLTLLHLSWNQLSGPIPPEIGNLSVLTQLWLDGNQLSGPIPPQTGDLSALEWLGLGSNQLSGPIPPEIGNLAALTWLSLHNNPFSGEVPTALTPLTLETFTFYDTGWCIPTEGDVPAWLSTIPNLYGTGLICGQDLGSLSGAVTLTDTTSISDVQVNLYRSRSQWGAWQHLTTTHTTAAGTYQFTDLGQGLGIDYRVQFVDSTHQLAPQYYDAKPTIATADVITITPGVPRAGIDAVLALPQPPAAGVDTESGSVAYNPDGTAQITMPRPNPSDITVTRAVTCTTGAPSAVTLTLSTGPQYAMANVSSNLYRATIPAADLTGNATLNVIAVCSDGTSTTTVGYVTLYDPSGIVSDKQTGQPVEGATVTLYQVPSWLPKTGPDDDRPNTCESNLSKAPDAPWSQPASTELGIIANADVTPTTPKLPYQHTTVAGYYGWDVSEGCWYVTIEAEDYWPLTSPVVGVPPEVTDLDLALMPTSCPTPLTDVDIVGPLNVTSTLYINTLYTFQAIVTPTDASLPIFYTWSPAPQTGQGTDTAVYRWSTPDTYTVTLTAENCGGPVTVTREFVIEAKDMFTVYLPLVLRNH